MNFDETDDSIVNMPAKRVPLRDLYREGHQAGRAEVLAKIATYPAPTNGLACTFCQGVWESRWNDNRHIVTFHHQPDCLWLQAVTIYLTDRGREGYGAGDGAWFPEWLSFLSGLPESKGKRRPVVIVQAFTDESGVKGQDDFIVTSTWLAEAQNWLAFSGEWADALAAAPSINYFKFSEAARFQKEFVRFSVSERDDKLRRLAAIIRKHAMTEQFCVLDMQAFAASSLGVARPTRDPYFLPFQFTIVGIASEVVKRGFTQPCEIVFDENRIFGPRARAWYPVLRAGMSDELRAVMPTDIIFRTDLEALPLQASDLTAGLRTRTLERLNGSLTRPDDRFDEWLWKELEGVVNVSEHSAIVDSEFIRDTESGPMFRSADEAALGWDAMVAQIETFGGDPIEVFRLWAEEVKRSRRTTE